ncbi:MAG: hypothetical protein H7A21_11575 [Spirochaetales bacterium]|nr:hypothetical protein [Leptospiraceae bacterium]MCP5482066.1 hypothetical protein [Spirochaetales bacterium]MCP5484978.1 hypothetical protein [Spirochaetales bacterium]
MRSITRLVLVWSLGIAGYSYGLMHRAEVPQASPSQSGAVDWATYGFPGPAGGNLIGCALAPEPEDYASEAAFRSMLEVCLLVARERGFLNEKSVLVLPRHVGTPLFLLGEDAEVLRIAVESRDEAAYAIARTRPLAVLSHLPFVDLSDPTIMEAVVRAKAGRSLAVLQRVVSDLAQTYRVTIASGTISGPEPILVDGQLATSFGPLCETGFVFRSDGALAPEFVRSDCGSDPDGPAPAVFESPAGFFAVLTDRDLTREQSLPEPVGGRVRFLVAQTANDSRDVLMRFALARVIYAGLQVENRTRLWGRAPEDTGGVIERGNFRNLPAGTGMLVVNLWL